MPCYHPLTAWRTEDGSVVFAERGRIVKTLSLPCGRCVGCRLERSRQWAVRCTHEASLHKHNCFITLTYDNDHLPAGLSLDYRDFQKFMRRFRKRFPDDVIRYYMCGEYGEALGRPHYHACIFGFDFPDRVLFKSGDSPLYTSEILTSLWGKGLCSVGDVTFQSAAYVSRYIMKKVTGREADAYYMAYDSTTGELFARKPEFTKMSLKPGIGAGWFDRYSSDVYPHDYVVTNGKPAKPPRYYDNRFRKLNPDAFEEIKYKRELDSRKRFSDNTDERLAVKEEVANARLTRYRRKLL